jgi:flagellar hook-basal body complex protein FliE
MPIAPITPISIPAVSQITPGSAAPTAPASGGSFGSMLMDQVQKLENQQQNAASQSQALATGQATDVAGVVSALEQASLSMQLAVQVRNKAVEAYNDIMHMQV